MNSITMSIENLQNYKQDLSITTAVYVNGSFDEWLDLVKLKFPNIRKIICRNTKLASIYCTGIKNIDCSYNKLTCLVTDADIVNCNNNLLKRLNLPNTKMLKCNNNKLGHLRCNNATYVECTNNYLDNLWLPNAIFIMCDSDKNVYKPQAKTFLCNEYYCI